MYGEDEVGPNLSVQDPPPDFAHRNWNRGSPFGGVERRANYADPHIAQEALDANNMEMGRLLNVLPVTPPPPTGRTFAQGKKNDNLYGEIYVNSLRFGQCVNCFACGVARRSFLD